MKGSTLIETLLYTALLAILIVGVFSSVYMLIGSEEKTSATPENDAYYLLQQFHE